MMFDIAEVVPTFGGGGVITPIEPPAPYPGGKRRAAQLVWEALGPVKTFVDPFCGMLAVPLACPWGPRPNEVVNDIDALLVNAFRAIAAAPAEVARHVDWPISEVDLLARRDELVRRRREIRAKLRADPRTYDAELAGWWLWGACQWIGGAWAAEAHQGRDGQPRCEEKRPALSRPARGILRARRDAAPKAMGGEKRPLLSSLGHGVFRPGTDVEAQMFAIAARIRAMKIVSGGWRRVLGRSTLGLDTAHGLTPTGIFLDPPYDHAVRSRVRIYAHDSAKTSAEVRAWALTHGDDPRLRVVLAGYAKEHGPHMPPTWRCVAWKSQSGTKNADQERLWLSPHCLGGTAAEPLFVRAREAEGKVPRT